MNQLFTAFIMILLGGVCGAALHFVNLLVVKLDSKKVDGNGAGQDGAAPKSGFIKILRRFKKRFYAVACHVLDFTFIAISGGIFFAAIYWLNGARTVIFPALFFTGAAILDYFGIKKLKRSGGEPGRRGSRPRA